MGVPISTQHLGSTDIPEERVNITELLLSAGANHSVLAVDIETGDTFLLLWISRQIRSCSKETKKIFSSNSHVQQQQPIQIQKYIESRDITVINAFRKREKYPGLHPCYNTHKQPPTIIFHNQYYKGMETERIWSHPSHTRAMAELSPLIVHRIWNKNWSHLLAEPVVKAFPSPSAKKGKKEKTQRQKRFWSTLGKRRIDFKTMRVKDPSVSVLAFFLPVLQTKLYCQAETRWKAVYFDNDKQQYHRFKGQCPWQPIDGAAPKTLGNKTAA